MNAWTDELSLFALSIVRGEKLSRKMGKTYIDYSEQTAIEVYRNNYCGNLQDALEGAYPVINQLVGDDFFRQLAQRFIERHRSHSGNLHHYGQQMADFVSTFAPVQELVYLQDMAALEWACHCVYFAEDHAVLDISALAQIPPDRYAELILCINPACFVVRSRFPIFAIWQSHQLGADRDFHIDLDSGPCVVLVSRSDDVVIVSELTEAEADWLQELREGSALGSATSATLERYADFDLQTALLNLVAKNILTDINLGATP